MTKLADSPRNLRVPSFSLQGGPEFESSSHFGDGRRRASGHFVDGEADHDPSCALEGVHASNVGSLLTPLKVVGSVVLDRDAFLRQSQVDTSDEASSGVPDGVLRHDHESRSVEIDAEIALPIRLRTVVAEL
jgi:hypothetical protein